MTLATKEAYNRQGQFLLMRDTSHGLARLDTEGPGLFTEKQARAIVRACNCFDELLAACKYAENVFGAYNESNLHSLGMDHVVRDLRAAIAKAEAPPPEN